jgi:putative NADH-flavin reductase
MHIVLAATGHVGSALAKALIDKGERVTLVMRNLTKAPQWQSRGAQVALVDVHDVPALSAVLRYCGRVNACSCSIHLLIQQAIPTMKNAEVGRRFWKRCKALDWRG